MTKWFVPAFHQGSILLKMSKKGRWRPYLFLYEMKRPQGKQEGNSYTLNYFKDFFIGKLFGSF